MADRAARVWRAAPGTLVVASAFTVLAAGTVAALGYLIYRRDGSPWISGALGLLALAALVYTWRFALHPRLRADAEQVEVRNPFSHRCFPWSDITVIAPGENGLIVGTEEAVAEAWCVQKSNAALRRGRFTRADAVAHELIDLLEVHQPPLTDEVAGLRIRRARPDESRMLTRIERATGEEHLEHIFAPEQYPYPVAQVTTRWRRLLRDRTVRVFVLEGEDDPLGFVAFSCSQAEVLHLGVVPHRTRSGYGSALLEFACGEIFDHGARGARLWVLVDNVAARSFYRGHGWTETDQRRPCVYPPAPEELQMVKVNPTGPRRSR